MSDHNIQQIHPATQEALFSVEVEQSVLGILFCNNAALFKIPQLAPEHFFDPVHARIFSWGRKAINEGRLFSPITAKFAFKDDEGLNALAGGAYLARLMGGATGAYAIADFAQHLTDLWCRRKIIEAAEQAQTLALDPNASISEIAGAMDMALLSIRETGSPVPLSVMFSAAVDRAATEMSAAYQAHGSTEYGPSTGLRGLDDMIGGFKPGRFYVLAGATSMGKTAVALNLALRFAARRGVVIASLEMNDSELAMRAWSQRMREAGRRISYAHLENGRLSEKDCEAALRFTNDSGIVHEPIALIPPQHRELPALLAAIKGAVKKMSGTDRPCGLVVVDYLQLIALQGAKSDYERVSRASNAMKALARDLDLPVLALSQLSRAIAGRQSSRPILSDLRASGEIEQDADCVMFAYRDAYYLERELENAAQGDKAAIMAELDKRLDQMEIIVAKQRSGRIGTVKLRCEMPFNFIEDAPQQPEVEDFQ